MFNQPAKTQREITRVFCAERPHESHLEHGIHARLKWLWHITVTSRFVKFEKYICFVFNGPAGTICLQWRAKLFSFDGQGKYRILKMKNHWFLCNGFIRVLRQSIQICCVFFPDILHRSNWGLRRWLHGFVEFQEPKQSSWNTILWGFCTSIFAVQKWQHHAFPISRHSRPKSPEIFL